MNKILLALTILGAGAGGFLTTRQSTTRLQHEAKVTREAWVALTQPVAEVHSDQVGLSERVLELKQALRQTRAPEENALWSALQTNRADHLTPELRERLLEELGFNWPSSEEFIVVSKETLSDIQMAGVIRDGKLTDNAATVLALTTGERGQVEAAMQRVQTDFNDWALAHVERSEPKDDVVAQYTLPSDPALSISNNFATGVFDALGRERAELIMPSARNWMTPFGILKKEPRTMIVRRYLAGKEQRLNVQMLNSFGTPRQSGDTYPGSDLSKRDFPKAFLPFFPDGWADVAKREGFELPKESEKK